MKKVKRTIKTRIFAWMLTVLMVLSLVPESAVMAAEADSTVYGGGSQTEPGTDPDAENESGEDDMTQSTIILSAQEGNQYKFLRNSVTIPEGIAKEYGYANADTVEKGQITALDALVYLHTQLYGDEFTKETAENYLQINAEGWITRIYAKDTKYAGFLVNGYPAHNGELGEDGSYAGLVINETVLSENDVVEFVIFQDEVTSGDYYGWFAADGEKTEEITAEAAGRVSLTLEGYMLAYTGLYEAGSEQQQILPIQGAQIQLIDENGVSTDIENAVTDENGQVTFTAPEAGKYTVSARTTDEMTYPVFSPWCTLTVTEAEEESVPEEEESTQVQPQNRAAAYGLDAQSSSAREILRTNLTDGTVYRGSRTTFDVWAYDEDGNKVEPQVTLNGATVNKTWSDTEKTSFTLRFTKEGENVIVVSVRDELTWQLLEQKTYHVTYKKVEEGGLIGYINFSFEAGSIGMGYLVEPRKVPVYEGENGAQLLARVLEEEGYCFEHTGKLESGFYLSDLRDGCSQKANGTPHLGCQDPDKAKTLNIPGDVTDLVPEYLKSAMEAEGCSTWFDDHDDPGKLSEFDFAQGSGYMYQLNNIFPNVGFSDAYPQDGDTIRVYFQLWYGADVGGNGSMGGGGFGNGDFYPTADKDELTGTMAALNSSVNKEQLLANPAISAAYDKAVETAMTLNASKEEVSQANDTLKKVMETSPATTLTLDQTSMTVPYPQSKQLKITVGPEGTTTPGIIQWSSSDESVATVEGGKVTAKGAGTATITAVLGELTASCEVTVPAEAMTGISLDKTELIMIKHEKQELKVSYEPAGTTEPRDVLWSSKDEKIAAVDESGEVTATGKGTTTITAKVGAFTAECQVTVSEIPLTGISLNKRELEVLKGSGETLTVKAEPENTTDDATVTWSTDDAKVATVNRYGRVTGIAQGSTTITAKVGDFTETCKVTVKEIPLTGITFESYTSYSCVKDYQFPKVAKIPANSTDSVKYTYSSSDENIATVDSRGRVYCKTYGQVTITATETNSGYTAQSVMNIVEKVNKTTEITLNKSKLTLGVGKEGSLTAELSPTNATDPIVWTSSDDSVAAVTDGKVTAVAEGTAEITAISGTQQAVCQVKVTQEQPLLEKVQFWSDSRNTNELIPDTAFDPQITTYHVPAGDITSTFVINAELPEGVDATMTAKWKAASNQADKTQVLKSGENKALTNFIKSGLVSPTLTLEVATQEETITYTFIIDRVATLSSLTGETDHNSLILSPEFEALTKAYDADVLDSDEKATLHLKGYGSDYQITVNEFPVDEQGNAAVALSGDTTTALIKVSAEGAVNSTYKLNLNKKNSVRMTLNLSPEDAVFTLKDSAGSRVAGEDNLYTLMQGAEYTYTAVKTGYISQTGTITADQDETRDIVLEKAPESTLTILPSEWANFRRGQDNMGITPALTPHDSQETEMKWAKALGSGWSAAPSVQIIVDDSLIVMSNSKIYKLDLKTGEEQASASMAAAINWGYTPPTYAYGMLFAPLANGTVQAFNAETLESLWIYRDPYGGQALSPITYSDGYVYTGFWNPNKASNYVCLPITDEDPEASDEAKVPAWTYTCDKGFYWAGAVAVEDTLIFGSDILADGKSKLYAVDKYTGAVKETAELEGDQRSTVSYDSANGKIYFTTKAGYLYGMDVAADGVFDPESLVSCKIGSMSTSTPVVYKGRIYAGFSTGGNFSGEFGVAVVDAATMETVYTVPMKGYPQGSVLLSTAYEGIDGYSYLYMTYNEMSGGITLIKDKPGQTEPIKEELFIPASQYQQYCITSIISGADGTLYYKTDSGNVLAVGMTEIGASRNAAKKELSSYKNPDEYLEGQKTELSEILAKGLEAIDAAQTPEEIESALNDGKSLMDAIMTKAELLVADVTLDKTQITLDKNGTTVLQAVVSPATALNKKVSWKSSNSSVAAVDANGKVTAKGEGKADITVTTEDGGKTAVCRVNVVYSGAWIKNNHGWWYRYIDGTWPAGKWAQIHGKWYVFDKDGYMRTGWIQTTGGWYYCDNSGAMCTGWVRVGFTWYYMNTQGKMQTGWIFLGSKWYYLNGSGAMQTGWYKVGNTWYYSSSSGAMQTGWQKIGGIWYYLRESGAMATGWLLDGKTWYYLNRSGAMQTGWQKIGGIWYYLRESGAMATGWLLDGKTWYYLNRSGAMQTGWQKIGGIWYYLKESGAMETGWLLDGKTWYYLNGSGAMQTGWQKIGSKWYYLYSSGAMAADTWVGNYYVNSSGVWVK